MVLDILHAGALIGSVLRSGGNVIARLPSGHPLGQFGDLDSAIAALIRKAALHAA